MSVNKFIQQLEVLYSRISAIYKDANTSSPLKSELLPVAFKELGTASEELQVATEMLHQQSEELVATRVAVEAERQYYQDLFEFAPDTYLVTDLQGIICQVNQAAFRQFNTEFLIGKPLALFVAEAERQGFRSQLSQLSQSKQGQTLDFHLRRASGELFDAAISASTLTNATGEPMSLCWMIRHVTERRRTEDELASNGYDPRQDHPVHTYTRGEVIPLQFQAISWVCQGAVKLSTLSDSGKEILIGIVGAMTPFGPTLTALPIFQAIALSDVQLIYIPISEITSSPHLMQTISEKISQRLRQTELLLTIAGEPRVKDRLWKFLLLLKKEIGESASNGTRLSIRFTHEELASACCTTRVTVTRLLNLFLQDGHLSFDAKNHIILHDEHYARSV